MTSFKITFRFQRDDYGPDNKTSDDQTLKFKMQELLKEKHISALRIYTPSWNSMKVIFQSEDEVNKVLTNKDYFVNRGFYPKISMALKAGRTIFCSGFDPTLLQTYDTETIEGFLENKGWKVVGVYVMKNKASFKIEFESRELASEFLNNTNTEVGGIQILHNHKENEVDHTVHQCWRCGILQTDHLTQNCPRRQKCLKCGKEDHQFFNCPIPKRLTDMSTHQKAARFCIPCGTRGNHTSLDHSFCPKKREIVQERIRETRDKRQKQKQENQRDLNLMKTVIDFSNTNDWPIAQTNKQHQQISTIVMLTLLEEAVSPGSFQANLSKAYHDNGLPNVTYTPQPNTANTFFEAVTGLSPSVYSHDPQSRQEQSKFYNKTQGTPKICKSTMTRYAKDQLKKLGWGYKTTDIDEISKHDKCIQKNVRKDIPNKDMVQPNYTHDISISNNPELTHDDSHLIDKSYKVPEPTHDDSHLIDKSGSSLVASNQYTSTEISAILDYLM